MPAGECEGQVLGGLGDGGRRIRPPAWSHLLPRPPERWPLLLQGPRVQPDVRGLQGRLLRAGPGQLLRLPQCVPACWVPGPHPRRPRPRRGGAARAPGRAECGQARCGMGAWPGREEARAPQAPLPSVPRPADVTNRPGALTPEPGLGRVVQSPRRPPVGGELPSLPIALDAVGRAPGACVEGAGS